MRQVRLPRLLLGFALLLTISIPLSSGCAQCRVPAIDPTGAGIFASGGQSTSLDPFGCMTRDGCCLLGRQGKPCCCFSCLGRWLPEPAFKEPQPPPACLEGAVPGSPEAGPTRGCGPNCGNQEGACQDECAVGPPAVLLGDQCCATACSSLPKKGKRGRLLLSPARVVAPVGGEVVLLSGVCGNDGYLVTGEPIEWMLTPESVGHFIEVAADDANVFQRLSNSVEVNKMSGSYARGVTRTKPALITRGTLTPKDDVRLEAGQAWATISSPTEGVSRITALAPHSDCWDQRKATTTIYWVDARWAFPSPQVVEEGSPVALTTRVTRSEGTIPAVGWKVKYSILNPELALFGPAGTPTAEAIVDDNGNAAIAVLPQQGTSGTATIQMEVIRPAQVDDNMPALPLGIGQTIVTWSAPKLELNVQAPNVAGFEQPITVVANVSNPGNLNSGPVEVAVQLPAGVRFLGSDYTHREIGNTIVWNYDEGIPAGVQGDINLTLASRDPFVLQFLARDVTNGLSATSTVRIDVFRPSLAVRVAATEESDRITVGEQATFLIEIENTGGRPLDELTVEAVGDSGLIQGDVGARSVSNTKPDSLQPGETWRLQVPYQATESGQRCLNVTATALGQAPTTSQACITVLNAIPQTPSVSAEIAGRAEIPLGMQSLFRYSVVNRGAVAAKNVLVTVTFPSQLKVLSATEGYDASGLNQLQLRWTIPEVRPGRQIFVEGLYRVLGPPGVAQMAMSVSGVGIEGAEKRFSFEVQPGASGPTTAAPPASSSPYSPPAETTPYSPPGDSASAPLEVPSLPGASGPQNQNLQLNLFDGGDPVAVGQEIRYTIQVSNRGTSTENQIQLRFRLNVEGPVRVEQLENAGLTLDRITNGYYYLPEIPALRPGQTLTYYVLLKATSPQTQGLLVEAYSLQSPRGVRMNETTRVVPQ